MLNKLILVWYFIGTRIQNAYGIDAWSHSAKSLSLSAQTVVRKVGFWSLNIRSTCWAMVLLENPGLLQKFTRYKSEFRRGDVIVFKQVKRRETFWTDLLSDEITTSYIRFLSKRSIGFYGVRTARVSFCAKWCLVGEPLKFIKLNLECHRLKRNPHLTSKENLIRRRSALIKTDWWPC